MANRRTPEANPPIRVILVEPRAVFGAGVREVLGHEDDIEVIGEARSADAALPLVERSSPDVILIDTPLPDQDAAEAARRLRRGTPSSAVIVIAGEDDDSMIAAVEIGAEGHVREAAEPEELVATIRRVADGDDLLKAEVAVRPDLVERLIDDVREAIVGDRSASMPLTSRELEVLALVANGLRNREIGESLGISEQTVKNHLSGLMHKLGVSSRTRAVTYAVRQGWLDVLDRPTASVTFSPGDDTGA
jgi:DNA-binding NarL/FixJ family response regulator